MRASSALLVGLSLTAAMLAGTTVTAHRLDEYLQSARVDLRRDGVAIDLHLTPGAEVSASIVAMIDRDRDGLMSLEEQHAYARLVAQEVRVSIDDVPRPLHVTSSTFPAIEALRSGEGAIRLQLAAGHPLLTGGRHQLFFSNGHFAGQGAYLANALVPASTEMSVAAQQRTADQRELTIDYTVGTALAGFAPSGTLLGIVAALLIVRYARRHRIRRRAHPALQSISVGRTRPPAPC